MGDLLDKLADLDYKIKDREWKDKLDSALWDYNCDYLDEFIKKAPEYLIRDLIWEGEKCLDN